MSQAMACESHSRKRARKEAGTTTKIEAGTAALLVWLLCQHSFGGCDPPAESDRPGWGSDTAFRERVGGWRWPVGLPAARIGEASGPGQL
eukprot:12907596-Alexandrium_andersonii.AAC.2